MTAGIGALATATLAGCIADPAANGIDSADDPAPDGDAAVLYTVRGDPVGTVAVQQEGSQLVVTFETGDSAWTITEAHLHVGSAVSDIPVSADGSPRVHDFERTTKPDDPTNTVEFDGIAIDNALERVVVAGHAAVQQGWQTTDVWAGTEPISDSVNGARYFEHDLGASEPPISGVPGISGRIVQADGEPGTDDRLVYLGPNSADDPDFASIYTDENGFFETTVPERGTYSLGYYQREQWNESTPERDGSPDVYKLGPVDVEDGITDLGTIELPDAYVLDVRVVDETGTPIENAPVNFYSESWGISRSHTTNADGYFQYGGLEETGIELLGGVRIQVWEPGVDPEPGNYATERAIELTESRTEEFVLSGISVEHEISATIYGPNGELATDDRLRIRGPQRSNDYPKEEYRAATDHNGYFNAEVENPGSYSLGYFQQRDGDPSSPERDGTPDIYHLDHVDIDGVVDLGDVELPQAHVLDVRVVDGSGNPIEGAPVAVWSCTSDGTSCWGSAPRETNADGYFQYDGLEESGAELVEHVMIQVWPPDVVDTTFDNIADERKFELTASRTEEFVLDSN